MFYNEKDNKSIELYSSAVTMSDMEIFIFPQLMFALVLANCMSPKLWAWKEKKWFKDSDSLSPYRRILRLKQYIIDNFIFNLDLDTWGLTTKETELKRFSSFIDTSILKQSNALFGYEGDKYYFDIDIRKHFGLDKYVDDIIPYWKTETIEAMEAFIYKEGYSTGAGECVSLAALYASALGLVVKIPFENIYMIATPLHSQNFIDINDGVLTNNRRIVTKNMWFNGTELSAKARRALENEKVTIVAHHSGYIHTIYNNATISPAAYQKFVQKLNNFLQTDITFEILASFLRQNHPLQKCFQIAHLCCGKPMYIEAEKIFHYEHNSKNRFGSPSSDALFHEIDIDEFYPEPFSDRILINELEEFFETNIFSPDCSSMVESLKKKLQNTCFDVEKVIADLISYSKTKAKLPDFNKTFEFIEQLDLDNFSSLQQTIEYMESVRNKNMVVDLAFMCGHDMARSPWKPFLKAALQRSPVSLSGSNNLTVDDIVATLQAFDNNSIYCSTRVAQPDEVWNFKRGDGIEKAICLINILKNKFPEEDITLYGDIQNPIVRFRHKEYRFIGNKNVPFPKPSDFLF